VALLGLRCSGKTTVGRLLAGELGLPFIDLDRETVLAGRRAGMAAASVGELLRRAGVARFRDLEASALRRILEPGQELVLATGGGVVERADNRVWLARAARSVFLAVDLPVLQTRLAADAHERPPLHGVDAVAELAELQRVREPLYRALAEIVVECGTDEPAALARRIAAGLGDPPARPAS
jgi:shikimate kinase